MQRKATVVIVDRTLVFISLEFQEATGRLSRSKFRHAEKRYNLERDERHENNASIKAARGKPHFEGTRIASLIPCRNFLSAGTMVASAPRNFTRSLSTK